jgi:choline dehydrogenase-like flavoprotein
MTDLQADYVIVGARSAGCVLADRLSEDGARVVLLEAGPSDWHPMIHVPAGALHLRANPLVNWNYYTEAEEGTANRSLHWPRGRVLGGTSSINGMLYVRGNPADYDGWAQMGCRGWSYADVLPYFKKSEHYVSGKETEYRGNDGPLLVEDYRTILPLTHRFVEAAQQAGFPFTPDYNGKVQEGVGYSQMTRRGRFRGSTARTGPRLDGARTCGSRQRRSRRGCCSTESAALPSPFARTAVSAGSPRRARWWSAAGLSTRRISYKFLASARPAICNRSASRSCTNCPELAPTFPTISRCGSRTVSRTRSRSTSWRGACGWPAR